MYKKSAILPIFLLSVGMLLTACGDSAPKDATSTATSSIVTDADVNLQAYYAGPPTSNPEMWAYYKGVGATTFQEDPAIRDIDSKGIDEKYKSSRREYDKIFGDMTSDRDQTSLKATEILKDNPQATLEELNVKDNLINRYPGVGSISVVKEESSGFYFVVFSPKDAPRLAGGVIVEQEGITPDFHVGEHNHEH